MAASMKMRSAVLSYLSKRTSLSEFRDAFAGFLWSIEDEVDDADSISLTYELEGRYAEMMNGDWSEDEFRQIVSDLINPYDLHILDSSRPSSITIMFDDSDHQPFMLSDSGSQPMYLHA